MNFLKNSLTLKNFLKQFLKGSFISEIIIFLKLFIHEEFMVPVVKTQKYSLKKINVQL